MTNTQGKVRGRDKLGRMRWLNRKDFNKGARRARRLGRLEAGHAGRFLRDNYGTRESLGKSVRAVPGAVRGSGQTALRGIRGIGKQGFVGKVRGVAGRNANRARGALSGNGFQVIANRAQLVGAGYAAGKAFKDANDRRTGKRKGRRGEGLARDLGGIAGLTAGGIAGEYGARRIMGSRNLRNRASAARSGASRLANNAKRSVSDYRKGRGSALNKVVKAERAAARNARIESRITSDSKFQRGVGKTQRSAINAGKKVGSVSRSAYDNSIGRGVSAARSGVGKLRSRMGSRAESPAGAYDRLTGVVRSGRGSRNRAAAKRGKAIKNFLNSQRRSESKAARKAARSVKKADKAMLRGVKRLARAKSAVARTNKMMSSNNKAVRTLGKGMTRGRQLRKIATSRAARAASAGMKNAPRFAKNAGKFAAPMVAASVAGAAAYKYGRKAGRAIDRKAGEVRRKRRGRSSKRSYAAGGTQYGPARHSAIPFSPRVNRMNERVASRSRVQRGIGKATGMGFKARAKAYRGANRIGASKVGQTLGKMGTKMGRAGKIGAAVGIAAGASAAYAARRRRNNGY